MKKWSIYSIIIFICVGVEASAQIRVEGEGFMFPGMIPETMFGVRDSLSGQSMPDVHIRVASRKDTVELYTDKYGVATVPFAKFNKDSVEISVSFMGYQPLSLKTALDKPNMVVHVTMMEDPMEINAIIVKDNSVLMVSKGDTVVYNAVAVKTLEGDNLEQLLRKLPGITIENGSIKAGGRDVNKILINGTLLFGSNMAAALRLIESQMVDKVKVYDQHAQDRMIEADTLGQKDHVIDVITKEKLTKVQEMKLMAALGLLSNYFIVYPIYMNIMSMDAILGMYRAINPAIENLWQALVVFNLPFTFCKGLISAVVTLLIYRKLEPVINGRAI